MAANKNKREVRFTFNDSDDIAFGHYRILYTKDGRRMVNRQRITYFISGVLIAVLFTVFKVDHNFTMLAYAAAAVIGIGGPLAAEKLLLRQQDKAIKEAQNSLERVHPKENIIRFNDDDFETITGEDRQRFAYKAIKLVDLTEEAIYVWLSDTAIMPIPLHAFRGMPEMKELYKWIREKNKEQGGHAGDDDK